MCNYKAVQIEMTSSSFIVITSHLGYFAIATGEGACTTPPWVISHTLRYCVLNKLQLSCLYHTFTVYTGLRSPIHIYCIDNLCLHVMSVNPGIKMSIDLLHGDAKYHIYYIVVHHRAGVSSKLSPDQEDKRVAQAGQCCSLDQPLETFIIIWRVLFTARLQILWRRSWQDSWVPRFVRACYHSSQPISVHRIRYL